VGNTVVRRPDGSTVRVPNPGRPRRTAVVCNNVAGFAVYVERPLVNPLVFTRTPTYTNDFFSGRNTSSNRLPRYMDIALELLNEKEARQAAPWYTWIAPRRVETATGAARTASANATSEPP